MAREAPLSLILCDVDFSRLQRHLWSSSGDNCLQQVVKAISCAVKRPADLVARYGEKNFAVILPNTDAEVLQIAESIRSQVQVLKIA